MSVSRSLLGAVSALTLLSLSQTSIAAGIQAPPRSIVVAMDDMKPMPDKSAQPGAGMAPGGGQSPQMGQKPMMMDDGMKSAPPSPMGDSPKMCSGSSCQQGGMMGMMDKMMGGRMGGGAGMGAAATGTSDVTERIEGRIAFLKAELQITDKQLGDWNALADALRSSRQHLVEARKFAAMDDKTTSADRLDRYERHMTERLEAIKSTRAGFGRLYPTLSDAQKQTADAILVPLIATF